MTSEDVKEDRVEVHPRVLSKLRLQKLERKSKVWNYASVVSLLGFMSGFDPYLVFQEKGKG